MFPSLGEPDAKLKNVSVAETEKAGSIRFNFFLERLLQIFSDPLDSRQLAAF